jgi:hypothetical protein
MATLLEQAKNIKVNTNKGSLPSKEDIELVLAWVKNDVTLKQIQLVKKFKSTSYGYAWIAQVLRVYLQEKI